MAVYIHGRFISIGQTPAGRFLYNKNVLTSAYNPIAAPAASEMLLRMESVFCNFVIFSFFQESIISPNFSHFFIERLRTSHLFLF